MALRDLLNLSDDKTKIGLSEERVDAAIPVGRKYVAFWREYPDLFVDFLLEKNNPSKFRFYFYQRIFLRASIRYRYVYCVYPRAYSKSFLSVLCLMLKAILYPNAKLFVTAGGKEQASGILKEKVAEICQLIPALQNEINWARGETTEGKDYCKFIFKNGSYIDNIAARESSRGKRRTAGLIEECVGVDGNILQTVILPTMNVSRRCASGETVQEEILNKSQIMITTAGWRGTFAYDKLIQFLIWQVVAPEKACVLGGTYRVPVAEGLLDKSFVRDLKLDGKPSVCAVKDFSCVLAGVA